MVDVACGAAMGHGPWTRGPPRTLCLFVSAIDEPGWTLTGILDPIHTLHASSSTAHATEHEQGQDQDQEQEQEGVARCQRMAGQ
jgi:hypothetical protein